MSPSRAASLSVKNLKTNTIGDFYSCVKWPLMTYRYFCLFPVSMRKRNQNSFSLKWWSPYMLFVNFPNLLLQGIVLGFNLRDLMHCGLQYPITSLVINYACGFLSSLFILKLAKDFLRMFNKILAIERKLPPIRKNTLILRHIPVLIVVGFLGSLIQCTLNVMYLNHMAFKCARVDGQNPLRTYLAHTFEVVFKTVDFNYATGIILQVVKFQTLFIPTLNGVFVMSCSVYLENRFTNLNHIIRAEQMKYNGAVYMDWRKIRDHYVQLTKLVKVVDKRINPIVFITFFIELHNSCLQFYYLITKKNFSSLVEYASCVAIYSGDLQAKFYKPYVALFVFLKAVTMSLICARLYTASREPLNCLHSIQQTAYDYDIHRFMEQVYHSKIALSGFEFFYITQEIILTVLRVLVTYELVLLQFK